MATVKLCDICRKPVIDPAFDLRERDQGHWHGIGKTKGCSSMFVCGVKKPVRLLGITFGAYSTMDICVDCAEEAILEIAEQIKSRREKGA